MTQLPKKAGCDELGCRSAETVVNEIIDYLREREPKADWLRSEIEKLEGIKKTLVDESDTFTDKQIGYNTAIDIIITWRKEELLELEKGV